MALNLLKLCVGAASIEDQQSWIEHTMAKRRAQGLAEEHIHTTRMVPKRIDELLDGGSLYWVIKGNVQVRERLIDIRPFTDKEGIRRCELVMDGRLVPTQWQPRRAFQGWRYLNVEDAPSDLTGEAGLAALPPGLRNELAELGLL